MSKALAGAAMHAAFGTDELSLNAVHRTVDAHCAVTLFLHEHRIVVFDVRRARRRFVFF
jgi:hypothetical protein